VQRYTAWLAQQANSPDDSREETLSLLNVRGSAEERARTDYTGRYPVEMFQNAHDACHDARRLGTVHFVLTATALLIANEGVPFNEERIESLRRFGFSDKGRQRKTNQTIGYKGIGFNAAFEISERPQIIGRDVAFGFDRDQAREILAEAFGHAPELIPTRQFSFPVAADAWADDAETVAHLFGSGAATVVRLPLRTTVDRQRIAADLIEGLQPEILLFSPWLRTLAITTSEHSVSWTRSTSRRVGEGKILTLRSSAGEQRAWLVATGQVPAPPDVIERLSDHFWRDVASLNFGIAFPWRRGLDPTARPQAVHVYYPTNDVVGRALLVHGDFYVTSDRRRVQDEGAGGEISRLVAGGVAKLAARLVESIASTQGHAVIEALTPDADDDEGFGHEISKALDDALSRRRIVKTATGRLRRPDQVRVFRFHGLAADDRREFARLFGRARVSFL
jgi:hypothetical protein